jgi:hypothetical protein
MSNDEDIGQGRHSHILQRVVSEPVGGLLMRDSMVSDADQIEFWSLSSTVLDPEIKRPPALDCTLDCAREHTGPYVNFLRFSY